jgi:6-phospho-3-hexuloisomerase
MSDEDPGLFDAVYECVTIQLDETIRCWERTSAAEVEAFARMLCGAQALLFAGSGRSCHILAASAHRFGASGVTVAVADRMAPPTVFTGTTMVAACASGGTVWLKDLGDRAKAAGATLAVCTGRRDSPLAMSADTLFWLDAFSPGNGKPPASQQRTGVLFDQALFMVLEAVAEMLEQRRIVRS